MRYRPQRYKYERVADYLRGAGWRSDFDSVARDGSSEKTNEQAAKPTRRKTSSRNICLRLKLLYETAILGGFRVSGQPHDLAVRDGSGRLAPVPKPRAGLRKRDGGNCGSALDIGTVVTAPRPSCESATNENWRKSILDKSLEFTGFHYQRLKRFQSKAKPHYNRSGPYLSLL